MSHRRQRVASVIQSEITTLLQRGRLKDPRIHPLTTVTGVEVASDLSRAKVFISLLEGEEAAEESRRGLQSAAGFIQRHLARALKIRSVPSVVFVYDPTAEQADRMNRLLSELPELHEPAPAGDEPDETE